AVKVLRGAWVKRPDALKRFAKEARILATIQSPHVVQYIDLNHDGDFHYLVLEYIRGRSLGAWLKECGQFEERTALAIVADVARALAVDQDPGIAPRDIKPENTPRAEGAPAGAAATIADPTEAENGRAIRTTISSGLSGERPVRVKLSD